MVSVAETATINPVEKLATYLITAASPSSQLDPHCTTERQGISSKQDPHCSTERQGTSSKQDPHCSTERQRTSSQLEDPHCNTH